jgi:Fe2+ or Zn2+ uptake regulation protein
MVETEKDLIEALRRAGYRITLQRRLICQVLAMSPGEHLTAADIVARADAPEGALDPSTVYRTLEVFEELGILHHVHLGHGPGIYHLSRQADHHHLVCENCGQVVDLPLETLQSAFGEMISEFGFVPDGLHFAILGRHVKCPPPAG